MAFATWQADPSDENTQALDNAEAARTQAQLAMQQAQQTYNDLKQQTPKMPVLSDFTESSADYSWGISDGSDADDSDGKILPPTDMITVEVMRDSKLRILLHLEKCALRRSKR